MIMGGGIAGPVALTLVGIVATSFISILVLISTGDISLAFRRGKALQLLIFLCYGPCVIVLVQFIPNAFGPTELAAWTSTVILLIFLMTIQALALRAFQPKSPFPIEVSATFTGGTPALVRTNSSVEAYKEGVVAAERTATSLDYIQWRIPPYYKTREIIEYIATQRFGEGNPNFQVYLDEHLTRAAQHRTLMERGIPIREIYPRERLIRYVTEGTHAENQWPLQPEMVEGMLRSWMSAILRYSHYVVAVTEESVPLKYHVVSKSQVILHEPVGKGDSIRLNSTFIYGAAAVAGYVSDFELLWSTIPPQWRDSMRIAQWIESELIPLAHLREREPKPRTRRTRVKD